MRVIVGVCGGIAAYKAAELVRILERRALEVRVVMTRAAQEFVSPLTFAALSGHRVITDLWRDESLAAEAGQREARDASQFHIEHTELAQLADLIVIAPATANVLAKLAHGIADDFLTTLALASRAPLVVAPAMNVNMWEHPATRANLDVLRARGVVVVPPGSGYLACGMVGGGRLAEPETIADEVLQQLHASSDFSGETVLVTAGGTREAIDPVRFIGNRSSGKMGYAVAEAAARRGANVTLVSAPTALDLPAGCDVVQVITAAQMRQAVLGRLDRATIVIKAAAVADFRPHVTVTEKIRREGPLTLVLEPTEDILAEAGSRKRPGTLLIGFAAETGPLVDQGRKKLRAKGADAIVANDISLPDSGFDSDWNTATFITLSAAVEIPRMTKRKLADAILDQILALRRSQPAAAAPVQTLPRSGPVRE